MPYQTGMSQMKMKCLNVLVLVTLETVSAIFSEGEYQILLSLARFFNAGSVVFVDDKENLSRAAADVKKASESNVASLIVTQQGLNDVLRDSNEWPGRTVVTTKAKLRLGPYLEKMEIPSNIVWALFSEPLDMDSIADLIPFSGEVLYIRDEIDNMTVYELLHPYNGGGLIMRTFGYLKGDGKTVDFPSKTQHALNKLNLGGLEIKVGTPENVCENQEGNVLIGNISCCHRMIFDMIADKINIRQKNVVYHEENYSFVLPNGSYAGYFKMLLDGEADVAIASFVATSKRMDDFDFIWPTFALETVMYVKKSEAIGSSSANMPFSKWIWIVTFFWMVLIGAILRISLRYNGESIAGRSGAIRVLFSSFLEIMQLTCNQGSSNPPDFLSGKIILLTTLVGGMLLEFYYSATVESYLTIEKIQVPFKNMEEFIQNGKYKAIALSDGFSTYYLKFESSLLKNKKQRYILEDSELPTTVENGIAMLCRENFLTLVGMRGTILNSKKFDCELIEIPDPVFFQFFALGTAKGYQLKDHFKPALWRLNELGIIQRMSKTLSITRDVSEFHKKSDYRAVTLANITNVFYILQTGIFLSGLILLLELVGPEKRKRKSLRTEGRKNYKIPINHNYLEWRY